MALSSLGHFAGGDGTGLLNARDVKVRSIPEGKGRKTAEFHSISHSRLEVPPHPWPKSAYIRLAAMPVVNRGRDCVSIVTARNRFS